VQTRGVYPPRPFGSVFQLCQCVLSMSCDCTSHPLFFHSLSHRCPGSCPPLCHVLPCLPAPAMSPTRHSIQMASMACTYAVEGIMFALQTQSGGGNMLVSDLHRYIVGLCDLPTIYLLHEGRVGRSSTALCLPIANAPALVLSFSSEGPSTSLRFLFLLIVSRRARRCPWRYAHPSLLPRCLVWLPATFLYRRDYFSHTFLCAPPHPNIDLTSTPTDRDLLPPQRRSAAPVRIPTAVHILHVLAPL
jgi:hypothetical protein